jgi:hypothetical protein
MFCEKVHHINGRPVGPLNFEVFFNRSSSLFDSRRVTHARRRRKKKKKKKKREGMMTGRKSSVTFLVWTHSRPTAPTCCRHSTTPKTQKLAAAAVWWCWPVANQ